MNPEMKKKAKLDVLEDLKCQMEDLMKSGLKDGLSKKKVVVAADSAEGLKTGLEKAKSMLPLEEEESEESDESMDSLGGEEAEADSDESEEDIDAEIAKLIAKKAALKK